MAQILQQDDGPQQSAQQDDVLREGMESQLRQAVELKTFHDAESERFDRIARAAGAALVELKALRPIPVTDVGAYIELASRGGPTAEQSILSG